MKKYWGYHIMYDCSKCNKKNIKSEINIRNFLDEILQVTKMKKLGEPKFENLQIGDKNLYGFSCVQLIHTSSITAHFIDLSGNAYIDIFSCKEFDPEVVTKCIYKYFSPKKVNKHFLIRDANI